MNQLAKLLKYVFTQPAAIGLHIIHNYMAWLPDEYYLKYIYRFEMGKTLNLKNPQTFQEKIQWLKLYNRKREYTKMVDKAAVKDYVSSIIGSEYIIPTLGIWDRFEDIDFDKLPDKFVLKTTHGGGGGGVVICKDKSNFDKTAAKDSLEWSLKYDIYKHLREWPYKDVVKRILAEEFLEIPSSEDLTDYKIFCFNGEPRFIQVIQDRHSKETIDFFDTEWNHQVFYGLNPICRQSNKTINKPFCFQEMLNIARKLAKDTSFIRVDLYEVNKHIYFGELTFFPASGIGTFTPEEWNLKMGQLLKLPHEF